MVGVAGKYKGCETCRRRRVKCSNERPFCQKCINSGRECEGYERERVFITGTPESRGRVSSHPKKGSSSRRQRTSAGESSRGLNLALPQPSASAWDDHIVVENHGYGYSVLIVALNTRLQHILRSVAGYESDGNYISLPPYVPTELHTALFEQGLHVSAECLVHLQSIHELDDSSQSYCVFFFEPDPRTVSRETGPDRMRRLGPAHFTQFPNHHFFARVYRPLAVGYAVLSRQETFLSAPEWMSVPWHRHPKCSLDQLLDLILFLPSIFAHTDGIVHLEATLSRRFRAQELLQGCLSLERQFDTWFHIVNQPRPDRPIAFWAQELASPTGFVPFSNLYTFRDNLTGVAFLYYWMAQLLFHRSIEILHRVIFQPVIDSYPNMWPNLPPELQIDVSQYQHGRDFAANICRGLDSALDSTVQPDLLVAPMLSAMDFYREINSTSQDGLMEIVWLDNFRLRLAEKGQHIMDALQGEVWVDLARF